MNLMRKGRVSVLKTWIFDSLPKLCPRECDEWGRSDGCLKSKRCDVNIYISSAARKTATIENVLHTPPLMLETSNEESESDEVEVLLTFSLLLLSSGSGQSIVPCLVHVLGCDVY